MPDVLVRNVDKKVLEKLKIRAERNGRSLQNELVDVFGAIASVESHSDAVAALRIKRALSGRKFSDSAASLHDDRSR